MLAICLRNKYSDTMEGKTTSCPKIWWEEKGRKLDCWNLEKKMWENLKRNPIEMWSINKKFGTS